MEENTTKIIIGIIALITALIGGALYSKKRTNKVTQSNIKIKGKKNKIVGGDNNSN